MNLKPDAQRVWDMCEDYVTVALQHLSLGGPYKRKPGELVWDTRVEDLRLNFWFPRIAEKGFGLLLNLRRQQFFVRGISSADRQLKSIESAHAFEQTEAAFEKAKSDVERLLPHLSAVQQAIVRTKFFQADTFE